MQKIVIIVSFHTYNFAISEFEENDESYPVGLRVEVMVFITMSYSLVVQIQGALAYLYFKLPLLSSPSSCGCKSTRMPFSLKAFCTPMLFAFVP